MDSLTTIDAIIRYLVYALILIGLPILIWFNKFWYTQSLKAKDDQINAKEDLIKYLEETQYDRARDVIKAQKELFDEERKTFENIISNLTIEKESKEEVLRELENSFNRLQHQLKEKSERVWKIWIEHKETGRYVSASDYKGVPVPDHLYKTKG